MHPRRPAETASIILVALCFTVVLAIALASYLALCTRSYDLSTRQLHRDKARELAQVGLEEALWALNQNSWNSSGPAGTSSWSTNGADHTITLTYPSLGQGASGQLVVTVANYASGGPAPANWPAITSAATVTLPDGRTFSKTLAATTKPAPLFGNAIASANSYVSFVSSGAVDSWNSDPGNTGSYTTAYSFNAGAAANFAAVVAATDFNNDYDGTHAVALNQALVDGYVATSGKPVSFSTSGSPAGRVKGPATSSLVNVDPMRLGTSAFIPAFPVFQINKPSTSGSNFGGLLGGILQLIATLLSAPPSQDTFEVTGDLTISGIPLVFPNLTINRPTQLIVDGNLTINSSGKITVTTTGSLEMYVAGDVSLGGNGIDNQTHDPRKFALFCTSSSTSNSLKWTNSATYYGVIYCENKPIDIRRDATFYGALLSGQYVRSSQPATAPVFHYDTALRCVRFAHITTPYVISRLTEP